MIQVTPAQVERLARAIDFHLPEGWSDELGRKCLDAAPARIERLIRTRADNEAELRDMLAAHALTGLLAAEDESCAFGTFESTGSTGPANRFERAARFAYAHADAMLEARKPKAAATTEAG